MTEQPAASGWYLIAHRGHLARTFYYANDREWAPGVSLGWNQEDIGFGPTHWAPEKLPAYKVGVNMFRMWPKQRVMSAKAAKRPSRWDYLLAFLFGRLS